jgi:hypothetical protein
LYLYICPHSPTIFIVRCSKYQISN